MGITYLSFQLAWVLLIKLELFSSQSRMIEVVQCFFIRALSRARLVLIELKPLLCFQCFILSLSVSCSAIELSIKYFCQSLVKVVFDKI